MRDRSLSAIALILAAMLVFQLSDNLVKLVSQTVPVIQLTFIRCSIAALFIFLVIACRGNLAQLKTSYPRQHLLRGGLFALLNIAYTYILHSFPISIVAASFAATPLLIAIAAPWLLKEKVSAMQWVATAIGFSGVLMILQPDVTALTRPMLVVLLVPVGYACMLLMSKKMAAKESGWVLNFYGFMPTALVLIPWVWGDWPPVSPMELGISALSAVAAVIAFGLLIQAFHIGRAAVVAPFEYSAILMALAADMLLWLLEPNAYMVIGVGLVLLCGMFQIIDAMRGVPTQTTHMSLMDTHEDVHEDTHEERV